MGVYRRPGVHLRFAEFEERLRLIHFVPGEAPPGTNVAEPAHQGIELFAAASPGRVIAEPLTEDTIESLVLGASQETCLLDQVFVGP